MTIRPQTSVGTARRWLATIGWAALSYAACSAALLWPVVSLQQDVDRLSRDESELASRVRQLEVTRDRADEFGGARDDLRKRVAMLDKIIPRHAALDELERVLRHLAGECAVSLERVSPLPEADREFYTQTPVEVQVEGGLSELTAFLAGTERLARLVRLGVVRIERVSASRSRLVATLVAYRYVGNP